MSKKVFSVDKGDPYKLHFLLITSVFLRVIFDVEKIEDETVEDDYQEEEQLDALLEDVVVPEELEDDFDPMLAWFRYKK